MNAKQQFIAANLRPGDWPMRRIYIEQEGE